MIIRTNRPSPARFHGAGGSALGASVNDFRCVYCDQPESDMAMYPTVPVRRALVATPVAIACAPDCWYCIAPESD